MENLNVCIELLQEILKSEKAKSKITNISKNNGDVEQIIKLNKEVLKDAQVNNSIKLVRRLLLKEYK